MPSHRPSTSVGKRSGPYSPIALALAVLILYLLPVSAEQPDAARVWTTAQGQTFTAALLEFDGTTATFQMPNGTRTQGKKTIFADADQKYLEQWHAGPPKQAPQSTPSPQPPQAHQPLQFTMPADVAIDAANIKVEVVSEDPAAEKFVYRTDHFQFSSQGKFTVSLLRDIARTFEATHKLLTELPWGINPQPPDGHFFKAKLFKNRDEYLRAGGLPISAGIYIPDKKAFLAPFDSIGLKTSGKNFTKAADFSTHTVVHELTHQFMDAWLEYLPMWVAEGTAEYTGVLPLKNGRFHVAGAKTGLKDYLDYFKAHVGGVPEPYPLEKLFTMTNGQWDAAMKANQDNPRRLYFTSYLLVYYFMEVDDGGNAQRFVRYFREIDKARKTGRVPHGAEKDAFDKKMLKVLLDGRTEDELMKEVRTSLLRYGIRF